MLGQVDLDQKVSKKQYKQEMETLSTELNACVQKVKQLKIPVVIAFEGWSAAGKGELINQVLYPLDPRDFNVYTMKKVNEDTIMRPYLWPYWTRVPLKGRIVIFDKSWHRIKHEKKVPLTHEEKENFHSDVMAFERNLADDGTVILKYFLHVSKDVQHKRLRKLLDSPSTKWRVAAPDLEQNKYYEKNLKIFESMIQNTNTGYAPWHVIEANDRRFATLKVYRVLIDALNAAIERKENEEKLQPVKDQPESIVRILQSVDVNKSLEKDEYKQRLEKLQKKMRDLGFQLYSRRKAVVVLYEGWDAAGKGGNIKRLTQRLDPRSYVVEPIAAPTTEELNHNYLWRFWTRMPKDGHISIFDRSWYGRVMVERLEGFCTKEEYRRAYAEMNNFEKMMTNHGTIVLKFWLQIDKDEQLKRFTDRENNPLKKYKITDEDWRNREKWDAYEDAVDEMLFRTSTEYAPWHIIESNCKLYARIKALEIATETIEKALKEES